MSLSSQEIETVAVGVSERRPLLSNIWLKKKKYVLAFPSDIIDFYVIFLIAVSNIINRK